jgi:hypothetical protein
VSSLLQDGDPSDVAFYVNCTSTTPSPFAEYISEANTALNASQIAWDTLNAEMTDANSTEILEQLAQDLKSIAADISSIENSVSCEPFHANYERSIRAACVRGLDSLFASAALHFVAVLLIVIAVSTAQSLWPKYRAKTAPYAAMNTQGVGETTPVSPWGSPQEQHQATFGTFEGGDSRAAEAVWYRGRVLEDGPREPPPPWYQATESVVDEDDAAGAAMGTAHTWPLKS